MTTNVGSYLLRDLKDPALPDAVNWLPQTIGWKIIALIAALFIARIVYKKCKFYWQNRYRNEARDALYNVNTDDPLLAINQYQQILNIVIGYINLNQPNQSKRTNNHIETMIGTATKPLNEDLLKDWYNSLLQPKLTSNWNNEKLTRLQSEIELWLLTHQFEQVSK